MRLLKYQFPPVLWAILIYFFSTIPNLNVILNIPAGADKIVHAGLYFILCWLTWRAFHEQHSFLILKNGAMLGAFIFCLVYGMLDEYHKSFMPGRIPEFYNVVADTGGALLFIAVALLRYRPPSQGGEHEKS